MKLDLPDPGPEPAAAWVEAQLGDLAVEPMVPSGRFRGGQSAADVRLDDFDVAGYASNRNEVWPVTRRGASGLSPYVRHGLLTLGRLWDRVDNGPDRDRTKFRDELLWQEFSRHLYARVGPATRSSLRREVPERAGSSPPWPTDGTMACVNAVTGELAADGWLVNQTRMWLASHWTVRHRGGWRDGEDWLFARLLDGSRAANRLGWQWTVGAASTSAYGFSRAQVERRAPGMCAGCARRHDCPIGTWPDQKHDGTGHPGGEVAMPDPRLAGGYDDTAVAGPVSMWSAGGDPMPDVVWLTAESMGDRDPALAANPALPVVFVFDDALLARIGLSGMRLTFMVETLAELATRRRVEVWRGNPVGVLAGRQVATTFAPVPGWERKSKAIAPVQVWPWPWLVRPNGAPLRSFSAWRKKMAI
jgi:deoxyribodipyrimidine photo-lyase